MLLNFQKRFVRDVWLGTKRQTIRAKGKGAHVPAVGDMAHCYTGLRTNACQRIGVWPIIRVEALDMRIEQHVLRNVMLGGCELDRRSLNALAVRDGFATASTMEDWFCSNHAPGQFEGYVISWDWIPVPGSVLVLPASKDVLVPGDEQ